MTEELPPCGHPECASRRDEMFALAKVLGFQEAYPGIFEFRSTDPETTIRVIRAMTGGVEGLARDLVTQAEEINRRAAVDRLHVERPLTEAMVQDFLAANGGRSYARKVGRRAFWQGVKQWLTHPFTRRT